MIENYDPNIGWGEHVYEFTFQIWEYSTTLTGGIGGNCRGFTTIEGALENLVDDLHKQQGDYPMIVLKDSKGDECEVTLGEDSLDSLDELKEMLVKVEIISHTAES